MPVIFSLPKLTPPPKDGRDPISEPPPSTVEDKSAPVPQGVHQNPFMMLETVTEEERSRQREAAWMSLAFHLVVILLLLMLPKIMPQRSANAPLTAAELLKQRDLVFMEMPPSPKATPPKDTDTISDQDRVASSRRPTIDKKTLDRLRDSHRPGAPGMAAPPLPEQRPQPQQQAGNTQQQMQQPGQGEQKPRIEGEQAKVEAPPSTNPGGAFGGVMSPGSAIEQAARESAARRSGYGGAGGEYGLGPSPQSKLRSDIDVMSDTMGVDFGPYLARILHTVRENWINLIPEVARAPLMKQGKVSIEFAILKDGSVAGMRVVYPSGDASLDRAAWGGITGSNPFPPLPGEFRGQYLALRFHFFYNPEKNTLR
ncbi:MAG: TonB C-terminal domain-containing protein [Acidobacteriales bacterium]|nr:TonB C-terminal domain-containing protein [Terriglobales bacterium]